LFANPQVWSTLAVTTEQLPVNATSNATATVHVASSCNKNNGFCFTFRFSNSMYLRNGQQFLPDAVKVDVLANTSKFNSTAGRLAILSHMLSTSDSLNLTDLHTQVDTTVAQAKATGGVAVCSADFVTSFNTSTGVAANSGYLNFARTATLVSAKGNSSIVVMAQVAKSASFAAAVNSMVNVNYANQAATIDTNFQAMANIEAIVYSFLADNNNATSITWDPEIGTANVQTSNQVVGGSAGGLTGGAVAGIVIACVAVVGVAGFFGVRAYKQKTAKKAGLLG